VKRKRKKAALNTGKDHQKFTFCTKQFAFYV
jgi:hypothetical protein